MFDTFDLKANLSPSTLRDVLSLRMGSTVAGTIRARVKDGRLAQMLDHFTQYVGSARTARRPCSAPSPTCRWPRASGTRCGGTRAVPDGAGQARRRTGRRSAHRRGGDAPRRRGWRGRGVGPPAGRSRSTPWSPTWTPCGPTASWSAATGRARPTTQEGLRARLLRAWCSTSASTARYDHLPHHDFVFSRDPEEEFDFIYSAASRRPIRPATSPPPPRTDPASRRGRRGALRPGPHALPAPAPRLVADVPRLPPGHPRQAEAHGRHGGHRGADRGRAAPHAAGHPRPLQGANGAIYGLASHGTFTGAFKPGNRSRTCGPLPRRRRRPPRARHADGDDVAAGSRPTPSTRTPAASRCGQAS